MAEMKSINELKEKARDYLKGLVVFENGKYQLDKKGEYIKAYSKEDIENLEFDYASDSRELTVSLNNKDILLLKIEPAKHRDGVICHGNRLPGGGGSVEYDGFSKTKLTIKQI